MLFAKAELVNKPEDLVGREKDAAERYPQGPADKAPVALLERALSLLEQHA